MRDLYGGVRSRSQAKRTTASQAKKTPKKKGLAPVPLQTVPTKKQVENLKADLQAKGVNVSSSNVQSLLSTGAIARSAGPLTFSDLMGYHLQCDINHDFGPLGGDVTQYNINGLGAKAKVNAERIGEDECVKFFLGKEGEAIIDILEARLSREQVFPIPDKTASFKNWKAPVLFGGGNDKVGIVQDAGEFITVRLGAQNVITFGSILDPAGKPKDKDAKPIWYDPGVATSLTIPLAPFGFDSRVISDITLSELRGGALVSAVFNPKNIDGVRMTPATAPLKQKPLNNTEIEKAGFFTSIKKAEDIGTIAQPIPAEALGPGVTPKNRKEKVERFLRDYKTYFYIGKTLGDAMLVASAMPNLYDNRFAPTIPNPFVSVQGGQWKDWISGAVIPPDAPLPPPTTLILKTGDRLNWLRAIIFNVGAIYEDQAKDGRSFKQYRYFPGTVDSAAIIAAIRSDFPKIRADVINRYTKLAASVRTMDLTNTSFAPGGMNVITSSSKQPAARQLLEEIANNLIQTT